MERPTSPEVTGGAGFGFEDAVVASYLCSVLLEAGVRGLREHVATGVDVQRGALGHPLDDLIVHGRNVSGAKGRLELQVKQTLTVSSARSNRAFRDVVRRAWRTLHDPSFQKGASRVGAVTSSISDKSYRAVTSTCEWARYSRSADDFFLRLRKTGLSGRGQRAFTQAVRKIASEATTAEVKDPELWDFLRHFVLMRAEHRVEGAEDDDSAIERLRVVLPSHEVHRAPDLWRALLDAAKGLAGSAGSADRGTLLARLGSSFSFVASKHYAPDLNRLSEEARQALAGISMEIAGHIVQRDHLRAKAEELLRTSRFLQIVGDPGTGKSALLRQIAERQRDIGFAVVLRADRLVGPGWPALATHLRLQTACLRDLLIELASTSEPVLYVDGIDRIAERKERETILDVLCPLLDDPGLAKWKVVATARDRNLEHLRTWLPETLVRPGVISTLSVPAFDESESEELAKRAPFLRTLLFGAPAVREISRRPFFLMVLARSLAAKEMDSQQVISEPQLIRMWWRLGGYSAEAAKARIRQDVLLSLARKARGNIRAPVNPGEVDNTALQDLMDDQVIREVGHPQRVGFAHDIFLEWTFFQLCASRGTDWLAPIIDAGEHPALSRVVELLSQDTFEQGGSWATTLGTLEKQNVSSQWTRSWLLGPFGSPMVTSNAALLAETLLDEGGERLIRLLVSMRSVKTIANPLVIRGVVAPASLSRLERMRLADALSWPRDVDAERDKRSSFNTSFGNGNFIYPRPTNLSRG